MLDRDVILANKLRFSIKPGQKALYLISSQLINIDLEIFKKCVFLVFITKMITIIYLKMLKKPTFFIC